MWPSARQHFLDRPHFDAAETSGEVIGERLCGKVLGGGEWALIAQDGFLRVDVRLQVVTHDGGFIYIQYLGLLEMNAAVESAVGTNGGTEYGAQYFYTSPRMETGDPRHAWVNTTFFIGEGRLRPGPGVEYRVWRTAWGDSASQREESRTEIILARRSYAMNIALAMAVNRFGEICELSLGATYPCKRSRRCLP